MLLLFGLNYNYRRHRYIGKFKRIIDELNFYKGIIQPGITTRCLSSVHILMVMFSVYTLLLLTITTDRMLARVIVSVCPDECTCVGTAARCDVTDHTLSPVLRALPSNLTVLDLSDNGVTHLKEATFRRFTKLEYLHLQQSGDQPKIDGKLLHDTPAILNGRLDGDPSITLLQFLRTIKTLREVLVDSEKGCTRCNYTRTSGKERCPSPGYCVEPRGSPFGSDDCACVLCFSPKSKMISPNCSQDHHPLASRLMGDSNSVRIALWLISSMAFVSNLVLIVSRCYTHALRQKPLSIFIACIALSNLFVTTSVVVLLASDMNQSPREGAGALGQGHWSQSVCGPVYFLKHFGIYTLVFLLTFVVMERFVERGYHRCFTSHLTVRRSVTYVGVAWVLSFLFIITPWTHVTKWHRMCTASHEATVAQVMYLISASIVISLCLFAFLLVIILFRRQTLAKNLLTAPTVMRRDLGLILVAALTLLLIGVPHSIVVIGSFVGTTSPETGAEIFTILLTMLCIVYPILLARYYPTMTCLTDSLYSSSICSCDKCKLGHYPTKCSLNSLRPPKSCITLSSLQESCPTKKYSTTITSTASVERMSQDSLAELDTWNSQTTKTKSWVETCDYDDLRRTRTQSRSEVPSTFYEVHEHALRGSDGNISAALVECAHGVETKSWVETCDYDDLKIIRNQGSPQAPHVSNVFLEMDTKPCTLTCSNENIGNCSGASLEHTRNSNTKSWVEQCDYDDLKKMRNPSSPQAPKLDNGLVEVNTKPRALTWSDEQDGTLTSVADDVFDGASSPHHDTIPELVSLGPAIPGTAIPSESTLGNRVELENQKTSDSGKRSKRLSSFMELLHRTFTSRRERSKSLPENPDIRVNKVERSQSVPFGPLDIESVVTIAGPNGVSVRVSPEDLGSSSGSPQGVPEERLASFFLIAPPKSPKTPRKNIFSPRKSKGSCMSSPSKSIADRIAKSFSLTRKTSPSNEPVKIITLEEGDILTELPVVRRNKLKTKPRDSTVRDSTASNGSTTTRFSLEWDPIGSMEGYADHEVLPPNPPVSLTNRNVPRFPQPPPVLQAPARYSSGTLSERYSSYSLDWDPTSVQPRNSVISRDSLSLTYPSDDEGSPYDVGTEGDKEGATAWV